MYRIKQLLQIAVSCAALWLMASPAAAIDGKIEISQVAAFAGGVSPGDTAGYPITISQPGSYVLTSDLIVPSFTLDAIRIEADDVSLDLNGFTIGGPNRCAVPGAPAIGDGGQLSCNLTGSAVGVRATPGHDRTTLRNGSVEGFASHGVELQGECRVRRLHVHDNGGAGVTAVGRCHVSHVVSERNLAQGIAIGTFSDPSSGRSVIHDSVTRTNGNNGVQGTALSVMDVAANYNGANGVNILDGGLVYEVTASDNGLAGIVVVEGMVTESVSAGNDNVGMVLPGTGYVRSVLSNNALGPVSSGVTLGFNVCNGVFGC